MAIIKIQPYIIDDTQDFTFKNVSATGNLLSLNATLGNLATANYVAGTLTTNAQPNITSLGTLTNVTVTGNITAGNLKSDNILYSNGAPYVFSSNAGGTNTQVQFNDNNAFAASANFTFNTTSNTLTVTNIVGNGAGLTSITGANVSGTVANATYALTSGSATTAGTVTTAAQPNITSVGTLSSVIVSGAANLTSVNLSGNIIPTISNTYSLGSETLNFKDVYIGPGSLYINGSKVLEEVSNTIIFTADLNQSVRLATSGTGDIQLLPSGTGVISVQGPLQILAGENITSSNGTKIGFSNPIGVDSITTLSANTELVITGNGSGNVKVDDDLIITGNLTLQGTTGNLSVTNLTVQDNIIDISAETTGAPTSNAGIRVIRGDESSTLVRWTESLTSWQFTNDGTNYLSMVGRDSSGNTNLGNIGIANNLSISGNAVITGNLTVDGNLSYVNVETLIVEDPIIELGNGPNGNALTTNDGKDRGSLLHYYSTTPVNAFMGWDNSNSEFAFGSNVTVASDVVSFVTYGNIRANVFLGNGAGLTSITGENVSGTVANATYAVSSGSTSSATTAGTVTTAAQPNITSVGTLSSVTVTGNITSGNASLGNAASANYFVGNGSLLTGIATVSSSIINGNSNVVVSANSNVTMSVAGVANVVVVSTDGITVAGNISANTITTSGGSGNITGANVIAGVTLSASGNISSGNANLGNAASANYFLGNGSLLTGISTSTTKIFNGTSNVDISTANGNVSISVAATANVAIISTSGIDVAGNISANSITTSGGSGNISGANVIAGVTLSASGQLISTVVTGTAPLSVLSTTLVPNLFVANATYATSAGSATIAETANAVAGANVSGAVSLATFATTANAVAGANVSGTVANATYALTSGSATTAATVTTNAQPNITSVGTLTSLVVTGNISSGNAALGNLATASFFSGSGNLLSNIQGGNVSGPVSFATTANAVAGANVSGAVANATYAITSGTSYSVDGANVVGPVAFATTANAVAGANVSGEVTFAATANAVAGANVSGQVANALIAGTVYTAAQPNITSTGTLTSLIVSGNITAGNANLGNAVTATYFIGNGSMLTGIGGGGGGTPGGANTYIQFNDSSAFAGNASLTFDKTTTTLTANNLAVTSTTSLGAVGNITVTGGVGGQVLGTNGSNILSWITPIATPAITSTTGITVDTFTGDGSTVIFTLSVTPATITQTQVNYNGVLQLRSAYTLTGSTIIFSTAPLSGSLIEVTTTQGVSATSGSYGVRSYTGTGSLTTFTVTTGSTASSVLVTENGVLQNPTTDYTVSGTVLTFTTAPENGVSIQIRELGIFVVNTTASTTADILSPFLLMGA